MIQSGRYGMSKKDSPVQQDCVACVSARKERESYKGKLTNSSEEPTIHKGIFDPVASRSHERNQYFLTVTTMPHRCTEVHLVMNRDEAPQHCFIYIHYLDRNMVLKVKRVHRGNAPEFLRVKK